MVWILWVIVLAILFSASIAGLSAAPWLPTKPSQRRRLLEKIDFSKAKTIIDLGCGDGSVLFAIAKKHPNIIAKGCDINILPFIIALGRKYCFYRAYKNIKFSFKNLYTYQTEGADIIFIFLLPNSYPKLIEKLSKEAKMDAQVIVEAWPLPNIEPIQVIKEENLLPIYIYTGKSLQDHVQKNSEIAA